MTMAWQEQLRSGEALRGIMQQATAALIAMDAERLEELVRCCADLNREVENPSAPRNKVTATDTAIRDAGSELAVLESVLFETRANLTVLSRLHANRRAEAGEWASASRARAANPDTLRNWNSRERKVDYGDN